MTFRTQLVSAVALAASLLLSVACATRDGQPSLATQTEALTWTQTAVLSVDDGGTAGQQFAFWVSTTGAVTAVGSPSGSGNGAVFVFTRAADGTWSQSQELLSSDESGNDGFGSPLSLSGNTLLVGAGEKTLAQAGQGAAYVFGQNASGAWTQTQELVANNPAAGDLFGYDVALSGTTALIGAAGVNSNQGSAYVFTQGSDGGWSETQEMTAPDGTANDYFGSAVALSGSTEVVGAPLKNVGANVQQGTAYVYVSGSLVPEEELFAGDATAGDQFGGSLAVSGSTLLIGAPNKDGGVGAAYVFAPAGGGGWTQAQKLVANDGRTDDYFGASLALSGNTALIGAWGHQSAYLFTQNDAGLWALETELVSGTGLFGQSVSLAQGTAVVGAPTLSGAAYVYAALQDDGTACTAGAQCISLHCVQSVCCNAACGPCGDCTTGTCLAVDAGSTGAPACAPYVCDGTDVTCPSSCGSNAACVSNAYCMGSSCVAKSGAGASCLTGATCFSGACLGNICCAGACTVSGACGATACDSNGSCVYPAGACPGGTCVNGMCQQPDAGSGGGSSKGCGCDGSGSAAWLLPLLVLAIRRRR
jgi:hypothetical protein